MRNACVIMIYPNDPFLIREVRIVPGTVASNIHSVDMESYNNKDEKSVDDNKLPILLSILKSGYLFINVLDNDDEFLQAVHLKTF